MLRAFRRPAAAFGTQAQSRATAIDTLASKLYFHGHPINRREAREELKLKVADNVPPALETAMWKLYLDFETELQNNTIFDPMADIVSQLPAYQQLPPGQAAVIPAGLSATVDTKAALIESMRISSAYDQRRRFVITGNGPQGEPLVRTEVLSQGWVYTAPPPPPAAAAAPAAPARPGPPGVV